MITYKNYFYKCSSCILNYTLIYLCECYEIVKKKKIKHFLIFFKNL